MYLAAFLKTMESFQEVINVLNGLNIDSMLSKIMDGLSKSIIEINQDDQLNFGIDSKNQVIETLASTGSNVYAQFTINERIKAGKQIKNVDLNFTGAFWKTFKVKKVSEGWEVIADFSLHGEDIRTKFNTKFDFLGLTPENLQDFVLKKVFILQPPLLKLL